MIGFRTKTIGDRSKNAINVFPNSTLTVPHSFLQLISGCKYTCPFILPVEIINNPDTNIHLLQSDDHFEFINTLVGSSDLHFKHQCVCYFDIWETSRYSRSLKERRIMNEERD